MFYESFDIISMEGFLFIIEKYTSQEVYRACNNKFSQLFIFIRSWEQQE